jgi:adenosine/AMP kinase
MALGSAQASLEVTVDKPTDMNVIVGQAHFIKTAKDLHEVARCRRPWLVRAWGNDDMLTALAPANALAIGAGHSFVILLRDGFPLNVLNPLKAVPGVCAIFCATANPVDIPVAVNRPAAGGSSA